jgi:hypothetical protein
VLQCNNVEVQAGNAHPQALSKSGNGIIKHHKEQTTGDKNAIAVH